MNWVMKNSQFFQKVLQKRIEKEAARKKTGHGNVCPSVLLRTVQESISRS